MRCCTVLSVAVEQQKKRGRQISGQGLAMDGRAFHWLGKNERHKGSEQMHSLTHVLSDFRDHRGRASTSATTHASSNEHEVSTLWILQMALFSLVPVCQTNTSH